MTKGKDIHMTFTPVELRILAHAMEDSAKRRRIQGIENHPDFKMLRERIKKAVEDMPLTNWIKP